MTNIPGWCQAFKMKNVFERGKKSTYTHQITHPDCRGGKPRTRRRATERLNVASETAPYEAHLRLRPYKNTNNNNNERQLKSDRHSDLKLSPAQNGLRTEFAEAPYGLKTFVEPRPGRSSSWITSLDVRNAIEAFAGICSENLVSEPLKPQEKVSVLLKRAHTR